MKQIKKIPGLILVIALILFTFFFYRLIENPDTFWQFASTQKLLPRILAWGFLLLGLYGIARRRFSMTTTMVLFALAFFFAYLGRFLFKELY